MGQPIKNNSKLLYLQARQLFENARTKFEDGTIKSEPKLVEAVFNSFQAFFTSMGKPNFIPRYAPEEGPPWSEDYNDMMNEILQDLELLFQELDILGRSLYTDFNHNMIQHEMLNKQYEDVLDKMRDLESYAGIGEMGVEIARDDFLNKSKIDYARISGTPLEIIDGAVTLPQSSRENVAQKAKATIVIGNRQANKFVLGTESNGFPGNNTEIHSVTDDVLTNQNYIPTFLGEENNHSDYTLVLDGSPNTWFEYEKANVREQDKIRVAKNLGWDYQVHESQTIQWAEDPDNGILKLNMQIILQEEATINQINCNMYTPPNYGAKTAIVKNILVSDGKEAPKSILPKDRKDDQYSFHFPPVKAKIVSVLFEQPYKYITDIGHIFYEKKMQVEDNSEYAMDMATKKYKYAPRVEGPLISLEDLGVQVKVSDTAIDASYPLNDEQFNGKTSIGESINRLMNSVDMDTVDMGVEKFEGFRWCIGIRDIEVFSCEYEPEGELVTFPYYFDKALDKISLNVNENIPSIFTDNPDLKYDWMKYFVSIDDGGTWYPITPMSHQIIGSEEQPPKIYTVRTIESSEQELENKKAYIESEYPVYSLRMKLIAQRPVDYIAEGFSAKDSTSADSTLFVKSSPIMNSYLFNVVTQNEIATSTESEQTKASIETTKPNVGEEPPSDSTIPPVTQNPSSLIVSIDNKKEAWCLDSDLIVKGHASSEERITTIEFYVNGIQQDQRTVSGTAASFQFTIPSNELTKGTITLVTKAYDVQSYAIDSNIINIIDCEDLPASDRPQEQGTQKLEVIIDRKVETLCECDTLLFYGSIQSPNPIQAVGYRINGQSIDPDNLGTPPTDDPCGVSLEQVQAAEVTISSYHETSDQELLQIESFGEWLDAFEEKNDCGCKNKRKNATSMFQPQAMPFIIMATGEERSFRIAIPYWKLRQLGIKVGSTIKVEVIAYDSFNAEAIDDFTALVKVCNKPLTDKNGNPRVRDCWEPESIELHYYNHSTQQIEQTIIPMNALPYTGVTNGIGTGITIGWRQKEKAPIIMQTKGYDESESTFQIHAVGLHYFNEYDQPGTIWTTSIAEKTATVRNSSKMIGTSTRTAAWVNDMLNGDYTTSPSLGKINDYVIFILTNEWMSKSCIVNIENFEPTHYEAPVDSTPDVTRPAQFNCNYLSHVVLQTYDEAAKALKIKKFDVNASGAGAYQLTTKNGAIQLLAGWSNYFKAPVIKLVSASGPDNLLIMAVGLVYRDRWDESQTIWGQALRYKTSGVQYPEFAFGKTKGLAEISWISDGIVDYSQAAFIGSQDDSISYQMDETVTSILCQTTSIDSEAGINPLNPPDLPEIHFTNVPNPFYLANGDIEVSALVSDKTALKETTYSISVNGITIFGPFTDPVSVPETTIGFPVSVASLQVGDAVLLSATAKNIFNKITINSVTMVVEAS